MTRTRLQVLRYFLFKNRNNVTFGEMIRLFFDLPYSIKAKLKIDKILYERDFLKIFLKNYSCPLFYPSLCNLESFNQVVVESLYVNNWHYYQVNVTKVSKEDIVVDCGAAEGLFTFLVSPRCKRVYAIEPLSLFNEALRYTFKDFKNVELIPVGLSSVESMAYMSQEGISSSITMENTANKVQLTTLDKLFFEKEIPVNYIKIDLEGNDYDALIGGKNLIKQNMPKIAVTTYHNPEHANLITAFLKDIHPTYQIYTKGIYQGTGCPIMLHAYGEKS